MARAKVGARTVPPSLANRSSISQSHKAGSQRAQPVDAIKSARELELLHAEIDGCEVCRDVGYDIKKAYGINRGDSGATVMAVGVSPSPSARKTRKAFAGNSFTRLSAWFSAAGFQATEEQLRRSVYLTSLAKCAVEPDTVACRRALWTRCRRFLWRQVDLIEPELVLLLGRESAAVILGDRSVRLDQVVGKSWTTTELFGEHLIPPTTISASWLVLPHPSGRSRTMNDPETVHRVVSSLRRHLEGIGFCVSQEM